MVTSWLQGTSRDGDPHDHVHNLFARMVHTDRDGKWRALDTMALRYQLPGLTLDALASQLKRTLGTRGGIRVSHYFSHDGEYDLRAFLAKESLTPTEGVRFFRTRVKLKAGPHVVIVTFPDEFAAREGPVSDVSGPGGAALGGPLDLLGAAHPKSPLGHLHELHVPNEGTLLGLIAHRAG